ncbi:MAG TPA: LON peptidase substrate-binding domain-containing protein [Acidimicrobiia bacterium]|nr:LON peptidase substrate-binding domain-containing protein [Acidimicrobiia bacterium]
MSEYAMFPLGAVVFPFTAVPLRVFEPRYQHLLDDVMAGDRTFGTVLIERGSEVGGGDERFDVGTVVQVASVGRLPEEDHRQIIVAGLSRFRVDGWLGEDPYPRAEVEPWPDDDEPVSPELLTETGEWLRRVLALASELGADTAEIRTELSDDPVTASYQAAALTPVSALDDYALLTAPGPASRLRLCIEMLGDTADQLNRRLSE